MHTFIQLCRVTAMRALREPVTVIFALIFAPAFIGCMGLIFGNTPAPEFGGKGFLEANFTAFPGIVIAITDHMRKEPKFRVLSVVIVRFILCG